MVSDVIVLYVLKKRNYYKENKYQQVVESDYEKDYEIITNPPEDPDSRPIVSLRTLSKVYIHQHTRYIQWGLQIMDTFGTSHFISPFFVARVYGRKCTMAQ